MKVSKFIMAAAVLALSLSSCDKSEGDTPNVQPGKPTYMEIAIAKGALPTYATSDQYATDAEAAVTTVDVFISDGASVTRHTRTAGQFTLDQAGGEDVWKLKETAADRIPTTTGAKTIFVGINLPPAVATAIAGLNPTQFEGHQIDVTMASLSVANNFPMFSNVPKAATFVEMAAGDVIPAANKVSVLVARWAAKIAVQVEDALAKSSDDAGWVKNFKYGIKQSNKKMFLLAQIGNVDPNFTAAENPGPDNTSYLENGIGVVPTYIDAIPASNNTIKSWSSTMVRYAAENSSLRRLQRELTYVSVTCQFVPEIFCKGDGTVNVTNTAATLPADFWLVIKTSGARYYFNSQSDADAYALMSNTALAGSADAPVKYTGGTCYYQVYLNQANLNYLLRNDFYKMKVKSVLAPGNPNSDPKDPDQPVETPTNILVDITILPWNMVDMGNIDLR